jgi:hypothetical protein
MMYQDHSARMHSRRQFRFKSYLPSTWEVTSSYCPDVQGIYQTLQTLFGATALLERCLHAEAGPII